MTEAQIFQKVREWIAANTELDGKIILANQNAPRPRRPFVTVLITSTTQEEFSTEGAPDNSGIAVNEIEMACMISVQCFGEGAKEIMFNLRQSLGKTSVLQELRRAGLPFIRVLNGVQDMTEQVGTQYEERAGMDIEFRTVVSVSDTVGLINTVEGAAIMSAPDGSETELNYTIGA